MKKDRNVGGVSPYAMYPTYQGMPNMPVMNPGMMMPNPGMGMPMNQGGCPCGGNQIGVQMAPMSPNTQEQIKQQNPFAQMQNQLNQLDRRITRLENTLNDSKTNSFSNSNYSDSNYHMM